MTLTSGRTQWYFQFSISCDEDPTYVLERVRNEWFWFRIGGGKLEVKEIQALDVQQTHGIYFVTTQGNDTAILVKELTQMMEEVKEITWMEDVETDLFKNTPEITLRANMPKIKGQDTSKLNKLPYDVMQDRRAFFLECDAKCADYLRELISLIKTVKPVGTTKTVLEQYWGQNARISEILTDKATPVKDPDALLRRVSVLSMLNYPRGSRSAVGRLPKE